MNRHPGTVALLAVLLAAWLWVTWRVFGSAPPDVPMGTATAYASFTVAPLIVELWKWWRNR